MTRQHEQESKISDTGETRARPSRTLYAPLIFPGVIACFILSGFAALLYQTAWLRQFSLIFGTSELAVATVLAAYMGGLALGATVAGRYVGRIKRPILVYGLLEAGIALSALAVPLLLMVARALYTAALGDQPTPPDAAAIGQPIFYLLVAFVVLAMPTGFMGATLPLLTRYAVRTNQEVGPRVALLYATNTTGAVLGTIVAAFVLLPILGLNGTVWVGVTVNGLVFLISALLAKYSPSIDSDRKETTTHSSFFKTWVWPPLTIDSIRREWSQAVLDSQRNWILPLILLSGATSFVYEVLWTRMLTHVMGGSIYAFATMLAAFLSGIALGGGIAGKIAEDRERATIAFVVAQIMIAALSMCVYTWMVPLTPEVLTTYHLAIYAATVMLPATIFIGATLPLAVRILARNQAEATTSTAQIYSWNTVGAIIGAILAGFYLIPQLGFEGTIKFAISINLALALFAAVIIARPKLVYVGATAIGLIAIILAYNPSRPQAVVSSTGFRLYYEPTDPREIYYGVGVSSTVMLIADGGHYYIRTNGLPEASILAKGAPPVQDPEKWLTALAVTARPNTEDMLVIGFGGGVALEGVPPSVDRIDVIELEPEVISANRQLSGSRNIDPLEDARFNIIINDARNSLRLTNKRYDAIISQPSHPWTAGASHLFTHEFITDAKNHLNDEGVFVQWINSEFVEEQLLRSLAATLIAEFPNVRLYHPSSQVLMFLASEAPLDIENQLARTGQPFISDIMHYSRLGMNGVEDLFVALAMDESGVESFASRSPLSTDNNNLMAINSRSRADGLMLPELMELLEPYDPLLEPDSWVHTQFGNMIDYGYITRRIMQLNQQTRATKIAEATANESKQLEIYGLLYSANGQQDLAREVLHRAVLTDPRNMQASYQLVKDQLLAASRGEAPENVQTIANNMIGPVRAVLEGWGYSATGDWASLERIDTRLGQSKVTDAWYPETVRLRAEWRTKVRAEFAEQYAFDAMRLIERALPLAPDPNFHALRVLSALALGDGDRVLESSRHISTSIRNDLATADVEDYTISIQELARMRQNLTVITNHLRGDLDIQDSARVRYVLDDINDLIENIDGYHISPTN
jgi:spermidine synthase